MLSFGETHLTYRIPNPLFTLCLQATTGGGEREKRRMPERRVNRMTQGPNRLDHGASPLRNLSLSTTVTTFHSSSLIPLQYSDYHILV